MRDVVREAFYSFNAPLEGEVPYFYQDVKGLVSIGVGILADPIHLAMRLPMVNPDGSSASANEIAAEWAKVRALGSGTKEEGNQAAIHGHLFAKPHTRLRMTKEGLQDSLLGKLHLHDLALARRFPGYETWPADAQLAIHSWAWGVGPAAPYPKMSASLNRRDFRAAAGEVMIKYQRADGKMEELYGLKPRNKANRALLINAAYVEEFGLDPERLWWPRMLETDPLGPEDDTEPKTIPSVRPDPLQAKSFSRFAEALDGASEDYRRRRDDEPPDAA